MDTTTFPMLAFGAALFIAAIAAGVAAQARRIAREANASADRLWTRADFDGRTFAGFSARQGEYERRADRLEAAERQMRADLTEQHLQLQAALGEQARLAKRLSTVEEIGGRLNVSGYVSGSELVDRVLRLERVLGEERDIASLPALADRVRLLDIAVNGSNLAGRVLLLERMLDGEGHGEDGDHEPGLIAEFEERSSILAERIDTIAESVAQKLANVDAWGEDLERRITKRVDDVAFRGGATTGAAQPEDELKWTGELDVLCSAIDEGDQVLKFLGALGCIPSTARAKRMKRESGCDVWRVLVCDHIPLPLPPCVVPVYWQKETGQ